MKIMRVGTSGNNYFAFRRHISGLMIFFCSITVQSHPITSSHVDISGNHIHARLQCVLDKHFGFSDDAMTFTRHLAIGKESAQQFSMATFATRLHQIPLMHSQDFFFNNTLFDREWFASLSSDVAQHAAERQSGDLLGDITLDVQAAPVSRASIPEPTTLMLVSLGILGLIMHRRRINATAV